MNARERFLAIATGGLVVVLGGYWMMGKFTTAVAERRDELERVETLRDQMDETRLAGEYSASELQTYIDRSMPGDVADSSRRYAAWLLQLAQDSRFGSVIVDPVSSVRGRELYDQLSFRVSGRAGMDGVIDFLHGFYADKRLHRIRQWSLRPSKQGDLQAEMTVDVLAMSRRDDSPLPQPDETSLAATLDQYRGDVLNRNLFQPPNSPPQLDGSSTLSATTGSPQTLPLAFSDPDGHRLTYELVDAPEGERVSINDNGSIEVTADEPAEFTLVVRVTDDGYPSLSTDAEVRVRVADPPPPEPTPEPPAKFDEAKVTVMTATLKGRDPAGRPQWQVWLRIRTRDETLRLTTGDEFDVGTVSGTVGEIDSSSATLQVDGKTYSMRPNQTLADAIAAGPIDE